MGSPQVLGVLDQGVASVSNLLLAVAVARQSSASEFGSFGIAFALYLVGLAVIRATVGSVAILRMSTAADPEKERQLLQQGLSAALLVTLSTTVVLCVAGIFLDGSLASFVLALGMVLPVLLVQDVLRFFAFALRRPALALLNDSAWLLVQVAAFGLIAWLGKPTGLTMFVAWGAAALAGVVAVQLVLRLRPTRGVRAWFATHSSLIRSLLTDQMFISASAQGAPLLVGAVSTLAAVGQLRGAQTAFGPVTAFNTGLSLAVVAPASRRHADGDETFHVTLRRNGLVVGVTAFVWGFVLLGVPDSVGTALLGESWAGVQDLAVWTGIWMGLSMASAPAMSILRILGREWWSARARVVATPFMLLAATAGAWVDGARGSTIGLASVTAVLAVTLWVLTRRAIVRQSRPVRTVVREKERPVG
jgi:O-antigen/teichoic acid export membrane protein